MTNKELIQENKWMREKLSSLCDELMAFLLTRKLFSVHQCAMHQKILQ